MNPLRISIVGAGKRVLETAIPALRAAGSDFAIHAVFARSDRPLTLPDGKSLAVRALQSMSDADVAATDVFYVAVGKGAVGAVLRSLTRFDVAKKTLLLDTPVLLWKQIHHLAAVERFGRRFVAEDCITLPWYDTVEAFRAERRLGPPPAIVFRHSAYKYHGLAMAKSLLHDARVESGSVRAGPQGTAWRTLRFSQGGTVVMIEPRNYGTGSTQLTWPGVAVTDGDPAQVQGCPAEALVPQHEGSRCVGFRIGAVETRLDEAECSLQQCSNPSLTVTARMEDWKRIGFLRLLRRLRDGVPGYPILAGLDDSLVDMQLDKFGRYIRNPFTTIECSTGRLTLSVVSRLIGR